jgi:hypothetical protein
MSRNTNCVSRTRLRKQTTYITEGSEREGRNKKAL